MIKLELKMQMPQQTNAPGVGISHAPMCNTPPWTYHGYIDKSNGKTVPICSTMHASDIVENLKPPFSIGA